MKRKTGLIVILLSISLASQHATAAHSTLTENQKALHVLNRLGYGARPGDMERVQKLGIDKYIELQLHPERIDDSATDALLAAFPSIKMDGSEIARKYVAANDLARELGMPRDAIDRQQIKNTMEERGLNPQQKLLQELQGQKLVRAVSSERQLEEVMADFWFNHFNIFWGKGADKVLTTEYEMNAIRPNVLGKFKDLVTATAKSPAMLFYLDNAESTSPNAQTPARERLEQLKRQPASLRRQEQIQQIEERLAQQKKGRQPGINENYARELMELHTMGVDGGYTQKDVQEVARAFTGWTIDRPKQDASFIYRDRMHDNGEKVVLGHRIKAGGIKDGEEVIDILVHQPSTARFIAGKLARRFVSDEPSPALVDRVAAVYTKSDGDIREMLRAIFASDEFLSTEAYRAKTKSPFELAVSSIRALGATTNGTPRLAQEIGKMGQPLYQYQAPTGFPDRASQWLSSGSLVERLNFGVALSANRIPGTRTDFSQFSNSDVVQQAVDVLLNGEISEQTRNVVTEQVRSSTEPPLAKAFALVLGSPEFQKK